MIENQYGFVIIFTERLPAFIKFQIEYNNRKYDQLGKSFHRSSHVDFRRGV